MLSLKAVKVILTSEGKSVFAADVSEGFVTVENNEVYITVNSANK